MNFWQKARQYLLAALEFLAFAQLQWESIGRNSFRLSTGMIWVTSRWSSTTMRAMIREVRWQVRRALLATAKAVAVVRGCTAGGAE